MLITSLVVETLPGKAAAVAERMALIPGMETTAAEGDHQVIARWAVPDYDTLEGLSEALRALNPEIIAVSPTVVGGDQ
jgi:nitrate reductase NapAB chaperone NapD